MKLNGIEFGSITGASGVQGFFGEGYWFHRLPGPLGPDFRGMSFVAKTTTLNARKGNMALDENFEPKELFPDCVVAKLVSKIVLNSVGLSGPGAAPLFERNEWQRIHKPFFLSFMSTDPQPSVRLGELRIFLSLLGEFAPEFRAKFGLQLNFSCPNVGLHGDPSQPQLVREVKSALDLCDVDFPVVPKFNTNLSPAAAVEIAKHPKCAAICISNTLPWDDWSIDERLKYFGTPTSPLEKLNYGKGGISGKPLLPYLLKWVSDVRALGLSKPLNAGGGILSASDAWKVRTLLDPNSSVFIGSVAILRPHRVRGIIRAMNQR